LFFLFKKKSFFAVLIFFISSCSTSKKYTLETIISDTYKFQVGEKPLYTNLEFWYDLQSKDTPYTNYSNLPSMLPESFERRHSFWLRTLQKLEQVDTRKLSDVELINYQIFKRIINERIKEVEFSGHLLPINMDSGFHTGLPRIVNAMPFNTIDDYERYISRLNDFPRYFEEQISLMRMGLKTGMSLPKEILSGYEKTMLVHIVDNPKDSQFYSPFNFFPENISRDEKLKLIQKGQDAILNGVVKAYTSFFDFFTNEYQLKARKSLGAYDLPNGEDYYQFKIDQYSTLSYSPEEVHSLGLNEVERIKDEMTEIIKEVNFNGSFKDFLKFLRTDKRFYAQSERELIKEAAFLAKKMEAKLPRFFKTLPRMTYGVSAVPEEIAPNYSAGRYVGPAKGSKASGSYLVNTFDLKSRPLYNLEALTFHEAVPGHHLQISISDELEDVPFFRQGLYIGVYSEGWALYSEWLGLEAGFYTDPYSNFGRLTYEMWRACRLVVDTGIHAFGWSRQEAIDYLYNNTALSLYECNTETDRYISWPGQALGYKIGQMKINELRKNAEIALGDKFDVRNFHDAVLWNGSVPLDILEKNILQWQSNQ